MGVADFLAEGSAKATAHALYDRKRGELVQLAYELGTESNWHSDTRAGTSGQVVAAR